MAAPSAWVALLCAAAAAAAPLPSAVELAAPRTATHPSMADVGGNGRCKDGNGKRLNGFFSRNKDSEQCNGACVDFVDCIGVDYNVKSGACFMLVRPQTGSTAFSAAGWGFWSSPNHQGTGIRLRSPSYRGMVNWRCYRKESTLVALSGPIETPPPATCGSTSTEFMWASLRPAAENFQRCHDELVETEGTLGDAAAVARGVRLAAKTMDHASEKVASILQKIVAPPPKGTGIANILGKIPKVGVFIKIALKVGTRVADSVSDLVELFSKHAQKIERAIKVAEEVFRTTGAITEPVATVLTRSLAVLEAADGCARATAEPYACGTAGASLEAINAQAFPRMEEPLEIISAAGHGCYQALNPVKTAMSLIVAAARELSYLLQPVNEFLRAVEDFVAEVERQIQAFTDALVGSEPAMCALEIFQPVTDVLDLATCPIDEAAGALFHVVVDEMVGQLAALVNKATSGVIAAGIDAVVPDNLSLTIPDFKKFLPTQAWLATCTAASAAFPEHATLVQELNAVELPVTITGGALEQRILAEALERTQIRLPEQAEYESACAAAYQDIAEGPDYKACSALWEDLTKASQCAVETVTDGAKCGWNTVTDGAECGYNVVADGAKCGFSYVSSAWGCVSSWFRRCRKIEKPNTCTVARSCNIARTCKVEQCDEGNGLAKVTAVIAPQIRGHVLKQGIEVPDDFTLRFKIKPTGTRSSWASIVHFTNGGDGNRVPGIWFHPRSTKLHVVLTTVANSYDKLNPDYELPLLEWSSVTVQAVGSTTTIVINDRVFRYDGLSARPSRTTGVTMYAGDPWYEPIAGMIESNIRMDAVWNRQSNAQCLSNGDLNPIWTIGPRTLDQCKRLCEISKQPGTGRPCVAIEWSDSGRTFSSSTQQRCALAWGCEDAPHWWGGSVYRMGAVLI